MIRSWLLIQVGNDDNLRLNHWKVAHTFTRSSCMYLNISQLAMDQSIYADE